MSRLWAGLVAILFILAITYVVDAQESILPQVMYQFEILELDSTEERQLVLEAIRLQESLRRSFELTFSMESKTANVFGKIPTQIGGHVDADKAMRIAAPAFAATIGKVSTLRVVEEQLIPELSVDKLYFSPVGVEISACPVQINSDETSIYSIFHIQTFDPSSSIHTEVWLQSGESIPLAVIELANSSRTSQEKRAFALFVQAAVLEQTTQLSSSIGGLGGLGALLWSDNTEISLENHVWLAVPLGPLEFPEGGFKLWLGAKVYILGEFNHTTFSTSHLGIGAMIVNGLQLELRWIHSADGDFIGLGLADHIEDIPGVILSGGCLPKVLSLSDWKRSQGQWWIQAEANREPFRISMRYLFHEQKSTFQAELGYQVTENINPFARLSVTAGNRSRIAMGARLTF